MVAASRGACRLGLCEEDCCNEIVEMVKRFELPHETDIPPELLIEAASFDKKRSGRRITIILPKRIGKCVAKSLKMDEFEAFVKQELGVRS
jgi:3-dehydroquinate synthetase